MLKIVRTLVSFALVGAMVWGAFTIELGSKTFAEHIDSIGATPEAKELIEGTRSTVHPALGEAKDRVLGEYVEAPTRLLGDEARLRESAPADLRARRDAVPARTLPSSHEVVERAKAGQAAAGPADVPARGGGRSATATRQAVAAGEPAKLPGRR